MAWAGGIITVWVLNSVHEWIELLDEGYKHIFVYVKYPNNGEVFYAFVSGVKDGDGVLFFVLLSHVKVLSV